MISRERILTGVSAAVMSLVILLVSCSAVSEPGKSDIKIWEEVDIIPMPKEIKLTGKKLLMNGKQQINLVIGKNAIN